MNKIFKSIININNLIKNYGFIIFVLSISYFLTEIILNQIKFIGTFGGKNPEESVGGFIIHQILNWYKYPELEAKLATCHVLCDRLIESKSYAEYTYVSYQPFLLYLIFLLFKFFQINQFYEIKYLIDIYLIFLSISSSLMVTYLSYKISSNFKIDKNTKYIISSFCFCFFYANHFSIRQYTGVYSPEITEIFFLCLFLILRLSIKNKDTINIKFLLLQITIFVWTLSSHLIFLLIIFDLFFNFKNINNLKKYYIISFAILLFSGLGFLFWLYNLDNNYSGLTKFISRGSGQYQILNNDGGFEKYNLLEYYRFLYLHPVTEKPFLFFVYITLSIIIFFKKKNIFDYKNIFIMPLSCMILYYAMFFDHHAKHPFMQLKFLVLNTLSFAILIGYSFKLCLNLIQKIKRKYFYFFSHLLNIIFLLLSLKFFIFRQKQYLTMFDNFIVMYLDSSLYPMYIILNAK
jgi:hypothetical protein